MFKLDNVTKVYGNVVALHNTTLHVPENRSLGIIGESGSGKTTLIRIMLGLAHPSTGTVAFRGEKIQPHKLGPTPVRRASGLVLQDPFSSLNPRMKIGQIIEEPLHLLKVPGNHTERVTDVLKKVGLDPTWTDRYPHELSGGQRQRVAIARALAPRPDVLVADEPVSALDVSVRASILDLLEELKSSGLTIIVVSHDLGIVQRMCDDTIVLADGHVVDQAPTAELLAHPSHPVTHELIDAVPHLPSR